MSSCRGILVAGVTNKARTQMAEGFLRTFTNNAIFICSGAWRHAGRIHPLAVRAMTDVGIRIDRQSSTSLEGARRQRSTYDVYVSIDEPYVHRTSDRYQRLCNAEDDDVGDGKRSSSLTSQITAASSSALGAYSDPLLAATMPSHWTVAQDTTDGRQSWTLWSPRDPSIYHETSIRKFQDDLYEGEPLFMRVRPTELRNACRVRRRWELPTITERYAMETEAEMFARVVRARDALAPLCVELIKDLEKEYGEVLLDAPAVAAYSSAAARAQVNAPQATEETGTSPSQGR
jgi:protein-tyrosine-phosphatase